MLEQMEEFMCIKKLSTVLLTACIAILPALSALAGDGEETDVQKSWDAARVYLPGQSGTTTPERIQVARPMPVVIYLHGCSGIVYENQAWGSLLAQQGFIVILPDSMARRNEMNCDPKTKKSGKFPQAHAMRQEEIRYAARRINEAPWWDKRNLFLMGHSEGGVAAARTKLPDFSGIIISGWRCTHGKNPQFDGIFAPLETPVLTVEWSRDDWQTDATKGSCSDKFTGRSQAQQLLLPGSGHNIYDQATARDAVARFLREHLRQ